MFYPDFKIECVNPNKYYPWPTPQDIDHALLVSRHIALTSFQLEELGVPSRKKSKLVKKGILYRYKVTSSEEVLPSIYTVGFTAGRLAMLPVPRFPDLESLRTLLMINQVIVSILRKTEAVIDIKPRRPVQMLTVNNPLGILVAKDIHYARLPLNFNLNQAIAILRDKSLALPDIPFRYVLEEELEYDSFDINYYQFKNSTLVPVNINFEKKKSQATEIMEIVNEKKIYTVYQPIVDVEENKIIGREALTRGYNKTPGKLFTEAEKYNFTRELDILCVTNAVENAPDDKPVFINILPYTLLWLLINGNMEKILQKAKSPIVFEIIESEKCDTEELVSAVEQLKKIGIKVAMDDFSQGQNRLHAISVLSPDYIKLDKKIITSQGKNSSIIIKNIVNMAKEINASVIAEGIETKEEYENILSLGVRYFQGYYFAKPGKEYQTKEVLLNA